MEVLKWITENWVNILAFMGALNLIAETITRANKGGTKGELADKVSNTMFKVASLGMHPEPPDDPNHNDDIPV